MIFVGAIKLVVLEVEWDGLVSTSFALLLGCLARNVLVGRDMATKANPSPTMVKRCASTVFSDIPLKCLPFGLWDRASAMPFFFWFIDNREVEF